jgi:formylglycine-generating enzyme required for sulfatase activity
MTNILSGNTSAQRRRTFAAKQFSLASFGVAFFLLLCCAHSLPAKAQSLTPLKNVPAAGTRFRECTPDCPEMMVIPPGHIRTTVKSFGESYKRSYGMPEPARDVTFSAPLAVGVYPVTRGEYGAFVRDTNRQNANGCALWGKGALAWSLHLEASWKNPGFPQTDRDPVVCVDWDDMQAYVAWLNAKARGKTRLYDMGIGPYRLLTADELEYATAAGTTTAYYWGDKAGDSHANMGAADCFPCGGYASGGDRWVYTSPVGSFPPNKFGLYDTSGNVWQVTNTKALDPLDTPKPNVPPIRTNLRAMGGSWLDAPERAQTGVVWSVFDAPNVYTNAGFRVARTLEPASAKVTDHAEKSVDATTPEKYKVGGRFNDCATKCPEMVVVPPGQIYRYLTLGGAVDPTGAPPILINITRPFAIGVYDVTRAEYAEFVKETNRPAGPGCQALEPFNRWMTKAKSTWDHPGFQQTDRDPVVCVSWDDAHDYVDWLNAKVAAKTGKQSSAAKGPYRIPSGNELDYATSGGALSVAIGVVSWPFYWGMLPSYERANFGLDPCCGGGRVGRDQWDFTSPGGSFPPNAFGLFDPFGNVWQFTEDCEHTSFEHRPTGQSAWTDGGNCKYREAGGGSFDDVAAYPGLAGNAFLPDVRNFANGFRVVRDLD